MQKSDKNIVWEKWIDPYLNETPETELPDFIPENTSPAYEESDEEIEDGYIRKQTMYAISSPMGMIPYNEYTASSKIFNFWIGHTNFDITTEIARQIELAEGVEILDIFTRYRFRIAVGKNFKDRTVMNNINKTILRNSNYE